MLDFLLLTQYITRMLEMELDFWEYDTNLCFYILNGENRADSEIIWNDSKIW